MVGRRYEPSIFCLTFDIKTTIQYILQQRIHLFIMDSVQLSYHTNQLFVSRHVMDGYTIVQYN